MDWLRALFSADFMPHGHCYFWKPGLVWLQVISNLLVGLSYVSISATLLALTRRIKGIPFHSVYLMFGLFIVLCGTTHFMDIVVVWYPIYWFDGSIRALTAGASVATALLLFPLMPRVVDFAALANAERQRSRTELERSLAERERAEKLFRSLVDNLPDLAWTATADGHIDFYNRRWYEYTGTTMEEMVGRGWEKVHDPKLLPKVSARWQHSLDTGEAFEMEFPLRGADGKFRWFLTRVRPLRDEQGDIVRWFGANTNIEPLRRAVEVRDEFISIASHELRTPLTALRLQVDLLTRTLAKDGPLELDRVKKWLGNQISQVDRLETLVAALLDVSRLEAGRFELERREADLSAVVRAAVRLVSESAASPTTPIVVRAESPVIGTWDPVRVDQLVTNLLANATKYGAGKTVEIAVGQTDSTAWLTVADLGVGIEANDLERIFERFERAADPRKYGGLGLGLWLSRQIVSLHGGTIRVTSEVGRGSTFTVELPKRPG